MTTQPHTLSKIIVTPPQLVDRGDGVRGHFWIGREVRTIYPGPFWEYYNRRHGEELWCSAGEVFIGEELAQAMLFLILGEPAVPTSPLAERTS